MNKAEYVGRYMDKKLKNCKLPYGLAYLQLRDDTEEKGEKLWEAKIKREASIQAFKLIKK